MRVLHVISCLVKSDGHSLFCMTLAERLTARQTAHQIFSLPSEARESLPDPKGLVRYATGRVLSLLNVRVHLGVKRQISAVIQDFKPDVVHLHGGWHPVLFLGARAAIQRGTPVILSLHGSLRPAVVEGDRRFKKRVAWWLCQRRLIERADVIHASTEAEAEDVARLGFDKPVVIIPNGVDSSALIERPDRAAFYQRWPECRGKRVALFLSRIHPLKGLDRLVPAWKRIEADFPDWHLLIAGPDENGYEDHVKCAVQQAGLAAKVTFCGPLYGLEKAIALASVNLFVLPTQTENFGLAVAEALLSGVPVITTKGAPWQELLGSRGSELSENGKASKLKAPHALGPAIAAKGRCGWWVEVGVEPLAEALREAMGLADEERHAMGENGRSLVKAKYRWETVTERMAAVYRGIMSRKP